MHALLRTVNWNSLKYVAYYTDLKRYTANFFYLPQRELSKKAVTKRAIHAGKMIF